MTKLQQTNDKTQQSQQTQRDRHTRNRHKNLTDNRYRSITKSATWLVASINNDDNNIDNNNNDNDNNDNNNNEKNNNHDNNNNH